MKKEGKEGEKKQLEKLKPVIWNYQCRLLISPSFFTFLPIFILCNWLFGLFGLFDISGLSGSGLRAILNS